MEIKKIVVCGAGVMGGGIAQVCANAGYEVWMYDLKEEYAQGGKNKKCDRKNDRAADDEGHIAAEAFVGGKYRSEPEDEQ